MVAKAGLGLVGLGALGIGGVALAKPGWLGINKEIIWKPLSQDEGFADSGASDPYKDKFGSTYKNYLIGTKESSKEWWEQQVKKITKPTNTKFKNIDKGFEGTNSLKSLCDEAYKKSETDLKGDSGSINDNDFKKSDVWKFCSPLGAKPSTVQEYDRSESKTSKEYEGSGGKTLIGKDAESNLISVNDPKNEVFWDIRNQEFHGKDLFSGGGKGMTVDSTKHQFFGNGKTVGTHIKKLCEAAYKQEKKGTETSSTSQATSDEAKKYCSLTYKAS